MRAMQVLRSIYSAFGFGAIVAMLPLASADPVVRDLGGGWQATIFESEISDLVGVGYDPGSRTLTVEKTARFVNIDEISEQPAPINILFTQTAPDAQAANRIAITRETITNLTGLPWPTFKNILIDGGQVTFNQALSAAFSITPYTIRTYNAAGSEVEFSGGVVPNGGQWFPGQAAGELVIDVDLSNSNPVNFTLKELPTPEPATALGLLIASAALVRRRMA